ncbi:MAG: NAD(+) diphosphatase [Bacillota bacterium]|nr:NAD(+) diphosphatase [Bacillota bacterium]
MLQDIAPHHFDIAFEKGYGRSPKAEDLVAAWQEDALLLCRKDGCCTLPTVEQCEKSHWEITKLRYLFSLDALAVYYLDLSDEPFPFPEGSQLEKASALRELSPQHLSFIALVSAHLHRWYSAHHFCGQCGGAFSLSPKERALVCPHCGLVEYPRINPAVIIAVTDGDRLLLSRYANRPYRRWALLAGYCEAGESLEETVRREVKEEVGLSVCNLRYYKSQPWPHSDSLLMGFYCDVEGKTEAQIDENELAEAQWFHREELPIEDPRQLSLTQEMIVTFREGREPKAKSVSP